MEDCVTPLGVGQLWARCPGGRCEKFASILPFRGPNGDLTAPEGSRKGGTYRSAVKTPSGPDEEAQPIEPGCLVNMERLMAGAGQQ